ncbi:MAG: HEPN domain-containing protein [Terriglobia bacterium]|jgi:HEPN domain-containing protein
MNNSPPVTLAELGEIDRLSFVKASTILDEARNRLKLFDHDLAVRRSQEAFELYIKSLFRFLRADYPTTHDLKKQIYDLTQSLRQFDIESRQVARLVLASSVLRLWRSPALYGDEALSIGGLFDASEAALAVSYAELGQSVCGIVRSHIYRRATVQEKR